MEPDQIGGTVYAMGVPVTSLKALSEYGAMLKANGIPSAAVITRLSMKDTEFPELLFEYVGVLETEPLEAAMLRNEQRDWDINSGPLLEHRPSGPIAAPGSEASPQKLIGEDKPKEALSADEAVGNW